MINFERKNYIEILLNILTGFVLIVCLIYWTGMFSIKNILLLLIIPLIIFIIYKPFWRLCLYAFMIPLETVLHIAENFTLLKFFGIFMLIGWILQFFISKQILYISKPIKLSLFFVAWSLISSLWAANLNAFLTGFMTLYKIQINE